MSVPVLKSLLVRNVSSNILIQAFFRNFKSSRDSDYNRVEEETNHSTTKRLRNLKARGMSTVLWAWEKRNEHTNCSTGGCRNRLIDCTLSSSNLEDYEQPCAGVLSAIIVVVIPFILDVRLHLSVNM